MQLFKHTNQSSTYGTHTVPVSNRVTSNTHSLNRRSSSALIVGIVALLLVVVVNVVGIGAVAMSVTGSAVLASCDRSSFNAPRYASLLIFMIEHTCAYDQTHHIHLTLLLVLAFSCR